MLCEVASPRPIALISGLPKYLPALSTEFLRGSGCAACAVDAGLGGAAVGAGLGGAAVGAGLQFCTHFCTKAVTSCLDD